MKINILALVTIIGCTASAVRASTCSESSGLCVCIGECPSFTANWPNKAGFTANNVTLCAVNDLGLSAVVGMDEVTVDGKTYTTEEMDLCSDAAGNSVGMVGAYYARAFVAAAAVAGGVAYDI